jgi:guanylate kinase
MLLILCGFTAVGKDSYQNMLLDRNPTLSRAISHTTRPMRLGEEYGKEYYFVDRQEFFRLQQADKFIETRVYATIENEKDGSWYYGLTHKEIAGYQNKIAIVDHMGLLEILKNKPDDLVVKIVYLTAPEDELRRRSISRADEKAEFERRLKDDKRQFIGIDEHYDLALNTHTDDHEANLKAIESLLEV